MFLSYVGSGTITINMLAIGEAVELDELQLMAGHLADVIGSLPEELFEDPALIAKLISPIDALAKRQFGLWVCGITA